MKYLNWDDIFDRKLVFEYFHHITFQLLLEEENPNLDKYRKDYFHGLRKLLKYNYDHRSPVPSSITYI